MIDEDAFNNSENDPPEYTIVLPEDTSKIAIRESLERALKNGEGQLINLKVGDKVISIDHETLDFMNKEGRMSEILADAVLSGKAEQVINNIQLGYEAIQEKVDELNEAYADLKETLENGTLEEKVESLGSFLNQHNDAAEDLREMFGDLAMEFPELAELHPNLNETYWYADHLENRLMETADMNLTQLAELHQELFDQLREQKAEVQQEYSTNADAAGVSASDVVSDWDDVVKAHFGVDTVERMPQLTESFAMSVENPSFTTELSAGLMLGQEQGDSGIKLADLTR